MKKKYKKTYEIIVFEEFKQLFLSYVKNGDTHTIL